MNRKEDGGQAIIELALALPMMVLLVFGVIEFGSALNHTMVLTAAAREGARVAGALANGGGPLGCGSGQSPNAATVDPAVVAAVERVLTASGTQISLADVSEIRIYKSTLSGAETTGAVNQWTYALNAGPLIGGERLDFAEQSNTWTACVRNNVTPADSVGITVRYLYRSRTPLRYFMPFTAINLSATTVMTLNATR
ncbi:MAG: pilus assembly protein [Chloroflexi bacterium]|nr:MAG: pilus assembly protein [Chloroflexota bacterium]